MAPASQPSEDDEPLTAQAVFQHSAGAAAVRIEGPAHGCATAQQLAAASVWLPTAPTYPRRRPALVQAPRCRWQLLPSGQCPRPSKPAAMHGSRNWPICLQAVQNPDVVQVATLSQKLPCDVPSSERPSQKDVFVPASEDQQQAGRSCKGHVVVLRTLPEPSTPTCKTNGRTDSSSSSSPRRWLRAEELPAQLDR